MTYDQRKPIIPGCKAMVLPRPQITHGWAYRIVGVIRKVVKEDCNFDSKDRDIWIEYQEKGDTLWKLDLKPEQGHVHVVLPESCLMRIDDDENRERSNSSNVSNSSGRSKTKERERETAQNS